MTDEQRLARYACDCSALPGRPHSPSCLTELNDETTDPVIPPEAVVALAKALHEYDMGDPWDDAGCNDDPMDDGRTCKQHYLTQARDALAAALPHLRPLFEVGTDDAAARWALLYSDAVDNGNELAQELRQDLKVATQVGLELGRQEAAEEIARRIEACITRNAGPLFQGADSAFEGAARMAREVATRAADARTDPSGHTDLPPTPDAAGSKRYPEEGDEWCCGTCQRIAWEANPMSREEQSAGETP